MRRLTAWIYGLLTALLLAFAAYRYGEICLELSDARDRLEQLDHVSAQLAEDNRRLTEWIGVAELADESRNSVGEQVPAVRTDNSQ